MSNPLLNNTGLPKFSQIQPEHVVPAIEQLIQQCRDTIEQVLKLIRQRGKTSTCRKRSQGINSLVLGRLLGISTQ